MRLSHLLFLSFRTFLAPWSSALTFVVSNLIRFASTLSEWDHKPIEYWSRTSIHTEHMFGWTPRDCLAIVQSVFLLRSYRNGTRFIILTYHNLLNWVLKNNNGTESLARWRTRLSDVEYVVVHRARQKYQAADALLRFLTLNENHTISDSDFLLLALHAQDDNDSNTWIMERNSVDISVLIALSNLR